MRTLSVGKIRGLQTTATKAGIFTILAIDHRDSLRVIINPDDPADECNTDGPIDLTQYFVNCYHTYYKNMMSDSFEKRVIEKVKTIKCMQPDCKSDGEDNL